MIGDYHCLGRIGTNEFPNQSHHSTGIGEMAGGGGRKVGEGIAGGGWDEYHCFSLFFKNVWAIGNNVPQPFGINLPGMGVGEGEQEWRENGGIRMGGCCGEGDWVVGRVVGVGNAWEGHWSLGLSLPGEGGGEVPLLALSMGSRHNVRGIWVK